MHETVLAFDYGLRRIGIAVGQQVTASASPLGVAANTASGPDWPAIERLVREWRPARLIVGLPLDVGGAESALSRQARAFAATLQRFGMPVEFVDERYSSQEAQQHLKTARAAGRRGRIDRASIDSAAAVLIAERWLGQSAPECQNSNISGSESSPSGS
jgi:putative Holliday junction resolvase